MNITATGGAEAEAPQDYAHGHGHAQGPLYKLAIGAIGIVFGDIGTSPIYAFRETFAGHHTLVVDQLHIFGVLSLIFWSMMIIVTLKYVTIIMRADNKGEGGSLALLALINRTTGGKKRWTSGDRPARRVRDRAVLRRFDDHSGDLGAVGGRGPDHRQRRASSHSSSRSRSASWSACSRSSRTARRAVGLLFGPVMLLYFVTLAVLGVIHIVDYPAVILATLNPLNAFHFFALDPIRAFIAMGSVVLAVTGAEALYADMGHFGRKPDQVQLALFRPARAAAQLHGAGRDAAVARRRPQAMETVKNPFFYLAPEMLRLPLVLLATAATIIASQAVISGAFSVTQQAIQLGFMPRLRITHTSESAAGQIYIPVINWALMVMVILLVLTFRSSSNLAAAYGIAVTGAMLIDTRADRGRAAPDVELEPLGRRRAAGPVLHRRRRSILRRTC